MSVANGNVCWRVVRTKYRYSLDGGKTATSSSRCIARGRFAGLNVRKQHKKGSCVSGDVHWTGRISRGEHRPVQVVL